MKSQYTLQFTIGVAILFLVLFMFGCSTHQVQPVEPLEDHAQQNEGVDWSKFPSPPQKRGLIAVAGFENKSTYSADRLWDTSSQILSSSLLRTNYFRVVEWKKMKQLFDWDALSQVSLIKSPEDLKRAQRILLCEYFISGSITYFDVSQRSTVSAMSKEKMIDTTIRVDLLLQDARSGEYLSTGTGAHTARQLYKGDLSGGQTGSWSSHSADNALTVAINKALLELIDSFDRRERTG